jgi:lipid-A-disaccharide synthase
MKMGPEFPTICLVAADVSGDQNGARLATALRKLAPNVRLIGAGGAAMRRAGIEVMIETGEVSVVGPPDSFRMVRSLVRVWRALCKLFATTTPDAAVLIDNETLNLLLARRLRKQGVPTAFFFPPQVWFWGRWRLRRIVPMSLRMLCAFREEAELYRAAGADAVWTGHPLRDIVRHEESCAAVRALNLNPDHPLVVLMPGSRRQEVRSHCRPMLQAAKLLQERKQELQFAIPLATESLRSELEDEAGRSGVRNLSIYVPESYAVLSHARVVLQCSGTATIETSLLGIPSVIVYQCPSLHYIIARQLMHVKFIGMVNILLEEMVQPEFFQRRIDPQRIAEEAWSLLTDEAVRDSIRKRLATLPERLGPPGALDRAARAVLDLLPPAAQITIARTRSQVRPTKVTDAPERRQMSIRDR